MPTPIYAFGRINNRVYFSFHFYKPPGITICYLPSAASNSNLQKNSIIYHDMIDNGKLFLDGECSEICPRHYNPMCGSDGITYGNECTFGAAKCLSKGELRLKKKGECGIYDFKFHFWIFVMFRDLCHVI